MSAALRAELLAKHRAELQRRADWTRVHMKRPAVALLADPADPVGARVASAFGKPLDEIFVTCLDRGSFAQVVAEHMPPAVASSVATSTGAIVVVVAHGGVNVAELEGVNMPAPAGAN